MKNCTRFFLAALLPVLSACSAMQSIDRGLHSAATSISQQDRVTGERTIALDNRQQQTQKGNAFAERLISDAKAAGKKINDEVNPVAYSRIVSIFSRLHQVSHLRDETWTPVLIEDSNWNALTTGGTYFVIYSALESDLKDDSELANVIAHEMAHTAANHVFEGAAFQRLNAFVKSKSAARESFKSAFTHENEAEADRIAVLYCALAGFDPFAGERIWERQYKKAGNGGAYIADHPINSERAAIARKTAEAAKKYYTPNQVNPRFVEILANNDVYKAQISNESSAGSGGGLLAALELAATTAKQREQARLEEQRQRARIQYIQSVQRFSRVVESRPVAATRWQISVNYFGNRALTDVAITLVVKQASGKSIVITSPVVGIVRPNTTFRVEFESPNFNAYQTNPKNVGIVYDNVRGI